MPLPLVPAVYIGFGIVAGAVITKFGTSADIKFGGSETNNVYNVPEQPDAEAFYFNSGDNVTDSSTVYLISAVTLFALYKWGK